MSSSLLRIQTIVHQAWCATYVNPSLLVFGLTVAILTLLFKNILFPSLEMLPKESTHLFHILFSPVSWFVLLVLFSRAFASSQIFILQASDFLRRPHLLTPRIRLRKGLAYTVVEILYAFLLLGVFYSFLITPILHLESTSLFSSLIVSSLLGTLFFLLLSITIIKRLTLGYLLLSPLHIRSSLSLSIKLFLRYRYFSILSFLCVLLFTLLFTILENLVMLQYAFVSQHLVLSGVFVYTILLLVNTLISIFIEVFWLNFFLVLTNKHRKVTDSIPLFQKELKKAPSIPS